MSKPILLVGAGGHARSCIDVIEQLANCSVYGLIGLESEVGQSILGYSIIGVDSDISSIIGSDCSALVTAGQIKSADLRIQLFNLLKNIGADLPVLISHRAYVSPHAVIGEGTIIMHGAVVNAGAVIGRNCIINSMALIEHDSVVGDHCHISTGARINGGVSIEDGVFIGSGCCVRQGILIGTRSIIGMGQLILKDCPVDSRLPSSRE